jgi:hypothetical protein
MTDYDENAEPTSTLLLEFNYCPSEIVSHSGSTIEGKYLTPFNIPRKPVVLQILAAPNRECSRMPVSSAIFSDGRACPLYFRDPSPTFQKKTKKKERIEVYEYGLLKELDDYYGVDIPARVPGPGWRRPIVPSDIGY